MQNNEKNSALKMPMAKEIDLDDFDAAQPPPPEETLCEQLCLKCFLKEPEFIAFGAVLGLGLLYNAYCLLASLF